MACPAAMRVSLTLIQTPFCSIHISAKYRPYFPFRSWSVSIMTVWWSISSRRKSRESSPFFPGPVVSGRWCGRGVPFCCGSRCRVQDQYRRGRYRHRKQIELTRCSGRFRRFWHWSLFFSRELEHSFRVWRYKSWSCHFLIGWWRTVWSLIFVPNWTVRCSLFCVPFVVVGQFFVFFYLFMMRSYLSDQ